MHKNIFPSKFKHGSDILFIKAKEYFHMKKKFTVMALAIAAAMTFTACSNNANNTSNASGSTSQEQSQASQEDAKNEAAEENSVSDDTNTSVDSESTSTADDAQASLESESSSETDLNASGVTEIKTKVLNKTGKVLNDVSFVSEDSIIGLDSIDDGNSVERKVAATEKNVQLEFYVEGEKEKKSIALEDDFKGFKLVILPADTPEGYTVDYQGIDEED